MNIQSRDQFSVKSDNSISSNLATETLEYQELYRKLKQKYKHLRKQQAEDNKVKSQLITKVRQLQQQISEKKEPGENQQVFKLSKNKSLDFGLTNKNTNIEPANNKYQINQYKLEEVQDQLKIELQKQKEKTNQIQSIVEKQKQEITNNQNEKEALIQGFRDACNENLKLRKKLQEQIEKNTNLETQAQEYFKKQQEILQQLKENQRLNQDQLAQGYTQNVQLKGFVSSEQLLLIIRRNTNNQLIMEFENSKQERFSLSFNEIVRIERDLRDEKGIRIKLSRLLNNNLCIIVENRRQLMNIIKRYWQLYSQQAEVENSSDGSYANIKESQRLEQANGEKKKLIKIVND